LTENSKEYSVRKVALRVGIEPAYLSKIERDEQPPPSETTIIKIAAELNEDSDILLAMAGKVSSDLRAIICARPQQFALLIRQLRNASDHSIETLTKEVRDGAW
jgi:transcriptional regulator with XRE-family HTH domain